MKNIKLLFVLIIIVIANLSFAEAFYSSGTLIDKFKKSSDLFLELRSIAPVDYGKESSFTNKSGLSASLGSFINKFEISSFKSVKPDAGTFELAGGIERIFIFTVANKEKTQSICELLNHQSYIEYCEADAIGHSAGHLYCNEELNEASITPNDPQFTNQYGLKNTGQLINGVAGLSGADINISSAWDLNTGNPNLIVGVLDSGVPLTANELSGRLLSGYNFAYGNTNVADDYGHGSNVSSVIGAKGNNGSQMAGVNWNSMILPVKILDNNDQGQYSWWISGITYAADNNAKVMNMSVGGSTYSQGMYDAITYARSHGSIVVACMMNDNSNVPYYPAAYDNVISIGAVNNRGKRAVPFCWGGGSSFGSHIDFCAPGEMIWGINYSSPNSSVNYWCGTSQATPMVTGVISLMLSRNASLMYDQIYTILKNTAKDSVGNSSAAFSQFYGWGRIDASAALNQVVAGINNIGNEIPQKFSLEQNYPNPFNPTTKITFNISKNSFVTLKVFDVTGREVSTIVNEQVNAGIYETTFDAKDFSSGIYYYTLKAGDFVQTKKMMLVK